MAVEEKLLKSLEFLKNSEFSGDVPQRNKEKIQNCLYITDTLSSGNIKTLPNFQQFLTGTFEILFQMCDDNEPDVRLTAEGSLNKIIKAMDNENTNRVLIELHKEIKKNGPSRSLKAALWRFSHLADLIRLPKRRQYLINFIPCIISMSKREEESIHEALMNSLPKILQSLGNFLSESDVKTLLNAFLKNIGNTSAVIRRASVNCLIEICINCRKPFNFLSYLLDTLLDLAAYTPNTRTDIFIILGVLSGVKHLIPYINKIEGRQEIQGSFGITKTTKEMQVSMEKLIEVYKMCLHFLLCPDDSVMSASLDTLNSLLRNCPGEIKTALLSPSGINVKRLSFPTQLHVEAANSHCIDESQKISVENNENQGTDESCIVERMLNLRSINELCQDIEGLDIGKLDDRNISLAYSARLICKSCLLTGHPTKIISDSDVRISVKNLALICLASLFEIYPEGFLLHLDRNYERNSQVLSDVLLFANHSDHQLRGAIRIVVASFLKSVLIANMGCYDGWFSLVSKHRPEVFNLQELLSFIGKGLSDESSGCIRQSLTSLNICLKHILRSSNFRLALPLLELLPAMAKDSHWLVKVKLLEVIVEIPFLLTRSLSDNANYQDRIVFEIVFGLLADEDQRVRTFASKTIAKIVPLLCVERRKTIEEASMEHSDMYFYNLELRYEVDDNGSEDRDKAEDMDMKAFVPDAVPFPFDVLYDSEKLGVKDALLKIVSVLRRQLATNVTNNTIVGYIEALSHLSVVYPTTIYKDAWNTKTNPDLLSLVGCLLDHELVYDIKSHTRLLRLYGNLISGICVNDLHRPSIANIASQPPLWAVFPNKYLRERYESFLNHVVKLLNVFVHVIEDTSLIEQRSITTPSLIIAGGSPLKIRKGSGIEVERHAEKKAGDDEERSDKKNEPAKALGMGHFSNSVHYMKIFRVVKIAYAKYKATLNDDGSENVVEFLSALLESLGQILEVASIAETSRIAEEILSYLQTIFTLEPTATVACVHQLLKSLFGSNIVSNGDLLKLSKRTIRSEIIVPEGGLHYALSIYRYDDMFVYLNLLTRKNGSSKSSSTDSDNSSAIPAYPRRKEKRHGPTKSDKMLANYIRLFEPMVIRSLKHYTITSNIDLQCAVLQLLNQLVRLKVNYCLLDSEQVFIKFIQKQFEFIEEGLVAHPDKLIPKLFEFLMNLSHGKQHSKSIIGVPKVIQLCDGLMASGQAPLAYCIPALRPIIADLFLRRDGFDTADFDELETTREVLLSMLLRLFDYPEVMDLLRIILNGSRRTGNGQRWTKWSIQTFEVFLARLTNDKLQLDDRSSMLSLMKWLIALHPHTFSSANERLLIVLFRKFPAKDESTNAISRWLGKVIIVLLAILRLPEDALLKAIRESSNNFSPESIFEGTIVKTDPLNVTNVSEYFDGFSAEIIFVKFVLRTLESISYRCSLVAAERDTDGSPTLLIEQLSHFLFICQHVYQSGTYCLITETTIELIREGFASTEYRGYVESINKSFLTIRKFSPSLTYQWCSILATLNYKSRSFWTKMMMAQAGTIEDLDLYSATSASAALISFSEYLIENKQDLEEVTWFVANNIRLLVRHCEEPPIAHLIQFIHRESALSSHLIDTLTNLQLANLEANFVIKVLTVVQNCHRTHTGALIRFLIKKLVNCRHLALLRIVVNMTCRKLEYLLTLNDEDIKTQMPEVEIRDIVRHIIDKKLIKKNETILGLLKKLCGRVYNSDPSEREHRMTIDASRVRTLVINKDWYLTQLTSKDCLRDDNSNLAAVFSRISLDDVIGISNERSKKYLLRRVLAFTASSIDEDQRLKLDYALVNMAVESVFNDLISFLKILPKHHQVYLPEGRHQFPEEEMYAQRFQILFRKEKERCEFYDLVTLVDHYATSFEYTDRARQLTQTDNFSIVVRFCVICLESIVDLLFGFDRANPNMDYIERALRCVDSVLNVPELIPPLTSSAHSTWLCSSINSLYRLVYFLLPDYVGLSTKNSFIADNSEPKSIAIVKHANLQLATIFTIIEKNRLLKIPRKLHKMIRSIAICLSKVPALNSYLLTPSTMWKGAVKYDGQFESQQQQPLPVDFLKDTEILEEYNFRISRLGWSSRKQFEETWMSLLSILNSGLIDENESVYSTSFAIKATTALLIRTLCEPIPGNVNNSTFFHVSRDTDIPERDLSVKKLKSIQEKFERKIKTEANFLMNPNMTTNVFGKPNIGKRLDVYSCGQISVAYLLLSSKLVAEEVDDSNALGKIYNRRRTILAESGLDLNSCIQSLLDLYSQWIKLQKTQSPKIFDEILKSLLIISDLFQQRSQFSWMLDICVELSKNPQSENENFSRYLTIALCKAAAVLDPDMEIYELIKKIIGQHIKSTNVSVRISCLHGLLYLLEGCVLANTVIGGLSEELQLLLPIATEYIEMFNETSDFNERNRSQEYTLTVWALIFFIIEHIQGDYLPLGFTTVAVHRVIAILKAPRHEADVYSSLMKALERLVINRCFPTDLREQITKLAVDKIKDSNTIQSFLGTQLLITCMYTTDYTEMRENDIGSADEVAGNNPDNLVQTVEKVSIIFDRIRKGLPFEVEVFCHVLPDIINDFFSPADILTKVVGEFLSPQQKHPALLSRVVFQVFENGIARSQLSLLRDWVVVSLSNFTQTFPAGMAAWYLTCFFVSASENFWLRSIFAHVRSRIGRFESEDREMLCIAGRDFYDNLKSEKQQKIFVDTFRNATSDFNDLLDCL